MPEVDHSTGIDAAGQKRGWIARLAKEPFGQFVVLGLIVWGSAHYWAMRDGRYTIVISPGVQQRIVASYRQQYGREPTREEREGLVDRHIREEIFLREGRALNLDKGDEIIRRRIVQKYEFLETDHAIQDSPSSNVLERWFDANRAHYLRPRLVGFSQVYFSIDGEGDARARERATQALERLQLTGASRAPRLGDPFPGPSEVAMISRDEATRVFGDSELSGALFALPLGRWVGPYRSGYGWHLIYVTSYRPAALPTLAEVYDRVRADYLEERRRKGNDLAFANLRAKYTVRYDGTRGEFASEPNTTLERRANE